MARSQQAGRLVREVARGHAPRSGLL